MSKKNLKNGVELKLLNFIVTLAMVTSMLIMIMLIIGSGYLYFSNEGLTIEEIGSLTRTIINCGMFTFGMYQLFKTVDNIKAGKVFFSENIHNFKRLGKVICVYAVFEAFISFGSSASLEIMNTVYGSLKLGPLVYFVAGLTMIMFSTIFADAITIKEENDLTI